MANKTIHQLNAMNEFDSGDEFAVYDTSANTTGKMTIANVLGTSITGLGTTATTIPGAISELNTGLGSVNTLLGSGDITSIGDGTITGAISALTTVEKNYYQYSSNGTVIIVSKIGKIVTINIRQPTASTWTRGQYITLTTLDTKYIPTSDSISFPIIDNSTTTSSEGTIGIGQIVKQTGIVRIWLYSNISRNSAINGSVTYILS